MRALRSYYVDLLHYWRLRTHLEPSGAGGWCFRARCGIEGDAVEGDVGETILYCARGSGERQRGRSGLGAMRALRNYQLDLLEANLCARTFSRRARAYRNANTI